MYVCIYIYYINLFIIINILFKSKIKVKSTITRHVKYFLPGTTTSKNLFKEIESGNSNSPGRALAMIIINLID